MSGVGDVGRDAGREAVHADVHRIQIIEDVVQVADADAEVRAVLPAPRVVRFQSRSSEDHAGEAEFSPAQEIRRRPRPDRRRRCHAPSPTVCTIRRIRRRVHGTQGVCQWGGDRRRDAETQRRGRRDGTGDTEDGKREKDRGWSSPPEGTLWRQALQPGLQSNGYSRQIKPSPRLTIARHPAAQVVAATYSGNGASLREWERHSGNPYPYSAAQEVPAHSREGDEPLAYTLAVRR